MARIRAIVNYSVRVDSGAFRPRLIKKLFSSHVRSDVVGRGSRVYWISPKHAATYNIPRCWGILVVIVASFPSVFAQIRTSHVPVYHIHVYLCQRLGRRARNGTRVGSGVGCRNANELRLCRCAAKIFPSQRGKIVGSKRRETFSFPSSNF